MLKIGRIIILLAAGAGIWQAGSGAWIHAKARLAQWLLTHAWERTLSGETAVRPWPWADTWPMARLRIASRDLDVIVLQGDSGASLAFGPGFAPGSSSPGQAGTKLISAHRDTHFRALADVRPGDAIELETPGGVWIYRVVDTVVVHADRDKVEKELLQDQLVLSTCYPFDAVIPGGPLRYLVYADSSGQKRTVP